MCYVIGPYDLVQISLAYGTKIFKECIERLQTSKVSVSNGNTEEF